MSEKISLDSSVDNYLLLENIALFSISSDDSCQMFG